MDAAAATVSSEPDGNFTRKNEQRAVLRTVLRGKCIFGFLPNGFGQTFQ